MNAQYDSVESVSGQTTTTSRSNVEEQSIVHEASSKGDSLSFREMPITSLASTKAPNAQVPHIPSLSSFPSPPSCASDDNSTEEHSPHPMNPLGLYLLSHPSRGRGVFAPSTIPAGTLIEESPVLVISRKEWEEGKMNDTILGSYGFCWKDGGMGIGLGLASLFNHSSIPNVNFIRSSKTSTIKFITSKKVEKGEELCICYSADESKLWFTKSDIHTDITDDTRDKSQSFVMNSSSDSEDEGAFFTKIELDSEDLTDELELKQKKEREKRLWASRARDSNGQIQIKKKPYNNGKTHVYSPQPIHLSSSRIHDENALAGPSTISTPSSRTSTPSSSSISISNYPEPSTDVISSLPPPLHSTNIQNRHTKDKEAIAELVDDLDWDEQYWTSTRADGVGREEQFSEFERVKGPAEREVEEDQDGMMDIWILEFKDPKLTRTALDFSKDLTATDDRMRHLKRVCRRKEDDQEICRIVLSLVTEYDLTTLTSIMTSFSTTLSHLTPLIHTVPSSCARTSEQLKIKSHTWPVTLSALPVISSDSSDWPIGRKAWVTSGIKRVLSLGLEAKRKGEIPIATYCTSQPSNFWPKEEGFIPPTEGLRASSNDTRTSENHPLRHATLNCVASIAHLRTIKPFTDVPPTRNGADYLLTSLTLFITHEPCVMCSMALLHSRVREVFYVFPRKKGGGFDANPDKSTTGLGIHARRDLNHRFEAWRYTGEIDENTRKELEIQEDLQV
ncbi:uncharacterized protein IL334_000940 [Kwoniella shivajii]|uniref:SET domain-containing protein n=1 Tax=Kwoniella shivajii TaxID=564305 RepID=A0ABZ1CQJ7_9TREE|nr:hypothetical protein IL334_000940 [Kwoniella shivajii]